MCANEPSKYNDFHLESLLAFSHFISKLPALNITKEFVSEICKEMSTLPLNEEWYRAHLKGPFNDNSGV